VFLSHLAEIDAIVFNPFIRFNFVDSLASELHKVSCFGCI
jgi:hypothetical protein